MSVHKNVRGYLVPALQDDAVLSQANPVSGTIYTVLAASRNVKLFSICAYVTWTVQPDPLEVHGTVDGLTLLWTQATPVSATFYYGAIDSDKAWNAQTLVSVDNKKAGGSNLFDARTVLIQAETTGGTVSSLDCRVKYGKW